MDVFPSQPSMDGFRTQRMRLLAKRYNSFSYRGAHAPIIAPIAMAASLGAKQPSPFGLGTLRDDTTTFGFLLLGTIIVIGALLFFPAAALGPLAEHFGPIPFGG